LNPPLNCVTTAETAPKPEAQDNTIGTCAFAAQDLVITNARIIDGNGGVIPDGIVVTDGRIVIDKF